MPTQTWSGSPGGDWLSGSNWTGSSAPVTGDTDIINTGTVELNRSGELVTVPGAGQQLAQVNNQQILLGSNYQANPAQLDLVSAIIGRWTTIDSAGTDGFATLNAIGPVGYNGVITAEAPGGTFTIQATTADGKQPSGFVLLSNAGSIAVTNGDDLVLNGQVDFQSLVTIDSNSSLTNNGTVRIDASTTKLDAGAVLNGAGNFLVGSGGSTLVLDDVVPASQTIGLGGIGILELGDPADMAGTITGFNQVATLELVNTAADFASYDASNQTLTIRNGGSAGAPVASLRVEASGRADC